MSIKNFICDGYAATEYGALDGFEGKPDLSAEYPNCGYYDAYQWGAKARAAGCTSVFLVCGEDGFEFKAIA